MKYTISLTSESYGLHNCHCFFSQKDQHINIHFATYCYSNFVFVTFMFNYEENIAFSMIFNTDSEKYQDAKKPVF